MPRENFYAPTSVEGDGTPPYLVVDWATSSAVDLAVRINGIPSDRSVLNRLIRTLKRARDTTYGADD